MVTDPQRYPRKHLAILYTGHMLSVMPNLQCQQNARTKPKALATPAVLADK